uniref:Uncharacterized protein n=1 Tax=Ditylenchus dipsaci TaxID=166011 RepID=A0A915E7G8_9BILA
MSLANHFQTEVRETIAASLHEIASIIGTKNTDRDLLPLFQEFLNDTLTVQYGLLRHLYDFCRVLSTQYREVFAQKLNQFVTIDGGKYRARADFAEYVFINKGTARIPREVFTRKTLENRSVLTKQKNDKNHKQRDLKDVQPPLWAFQ